jgi:acyl dehydratase
MNGTPANRSLFVSALPLVRLAARRLPVAGGDRPLPAIEVARPATVVDAAWLRAYCAAVGAPNDGTAPPCTPQVLAVDLHLAILEDPRFPLPALGMVHSRNVIHELVPIRAGDVLDLRAALTSLTPTDNGTRFEIETEARRGGQLVWRSATVAISRPKRARDGQKRSPAAEEARAPVVVSSMVRAAASTGRTYARVSGDANPIHLWPLTARAFGFPRAIAHGMWTLARGVAETADCLPPMPRTFDVRFVRPVLLPSTILVEATRPERGACTLRVAPAAGGNPHLVGTVGPLVDATLGAGMASPA